MACESKSSFMVCPFVIVGVWKQQHITAGCTTYLEAA
jgi:hypothetical protein